MYEPVWKTQLALELEALAQPSISKHITPQQQQYHITLSVPGAQGGSARHGNTVWGTQGTSAQQVKEAAGLGCADTANTIYSALGLAAVCPHPKWRGVRSSVGGMWSTDPHSISLTELRGSAMTTQTSGSNLQWQASGGEAACGTGTRERADCSCGHTSAFQGSTTLTMATSESLRSIPHICSLPPTSQSCRF